VDDAALGPLLGTGKEAEVFAYGAAVAKLYRTGAGKAVAFREAAILAMVETVGLPTPGVHAVDRFGDRWGIVMGRADGVSFGAAMQQTPTAAPRYIEAMAALHRAIHARSLPQLGSLKARLATNIGRAPQLDDALRAKLLAGLAEMPDGAQLCHGDFHPFNILGEPGAAMVVDWLDATAGDPAADVCRSYVLMRPRWESVARDYVDSYVAATGVSRAAVMAWLPFVAAARLAEGVPQEEAALLALAEAGFRGASPHGG